MTMDYYKDLEDLNEEQLNKNAGVIVFVAVCMLFGIIGNAATFLFFGIQNKCLTVSFSRQTQSITNFLISALAINDLITSVVLIDVILEHVYYVTFMSSPLCKVYSFINRVLVCNSILFLLLIGIERFWQICLALRFKKQITLALIVKCLIGIIIFDVITSAPDLYTYESTNHTVRLGNNQTINVFSCMVSSEPSKKAFDDVMSYFDQVMLIVAIAALAVMYAFIIRKITKMRKRLSKHLHITPKDNSHNSTASEVNETQISNIVDSPRDVHNISEEEAGTYHTINGSDCENGIANERKDGIYDQDNSKQDQNRNKGDTVVKFQNGQQLSQESQSDQSTTLQSKNGLAQTPTQSMGKKSSKKTEPSDVEKRLAVMTAVITLVSILSFLPHFIADIFITRDTIITTSAWVRTAYISYVLNSTLNPYVIGLFNANFRQYVLQKFKCSCCRH